MSGAISSIAVFKSHLLPYSETFVLEQGETLARYRPHYIGCRRVADGLQLPEERTFALNGPGPFGKRGTPSGAVRELIFKSTGRSIALERHLCKVNPLLMHAHFADSGAIACPLAERLQLPLAVSLHGYDVTLSNRALMDGSVTQRAYAFRQDDLKNQATVFLAVSHFIRQRAIARGFPADKTITHYTGVDTDYFTPDPTTERRQQVLFVGRLTEVKGCDYLLRAMGKVACKHREVETLVIGDGPQRKELENIAWQMPGRFRFLGRQNAAVVRQMMRESRVLCVPSTVTATRAEEGFGQIFAEAQACGLPVVSFATGGVREAVADGETGFLAEDKDTSALAEAITRLLDDDILWHRFSRRAREYVREYFDLTRQCARLEEIYDAIVAHEQLPLQKAA